MAGNDDDDYDPRKPPNSPHGWKRVNEGADKGAKSWMVVAPIYVVATNWRLFAAAIVIAGLIIRFVRPDIWNAVAGMPGVSK